MKILFIADPHIPVPPIHYGGAERIIHLYAQEFTRLGHTVHLMAGIGSRSYGSGRLHLHRAPSKAYLSRAHRKIQFQVQSLWAARDCDIVYSHGRFDYLEALVRFQKPILHRFPNPIDQEQIDFAEKRIARNLVFHLMSENQRSQAQIKTPSVVIPNPIDSKIYQPCYESGEYLVFLGRLTRNKGVDIAIEVARQTQKKLIIAGNISKEEGGEAFFQQEVEPHLDGEQIRWVGPVNDHQKQELLSKAKALLFPIRWEEPFGIVMIEALACGTPVIATRRAATPEIIEHGRTGFLCDPAEPSAQAFANAVVELPHVNRIHCRHAAEDRFDIKIIAPRVLKVLGKLCKTI